MKNFDQKYLTEIVGKYIQPWIDTGISMELYFDLNNPQINVLTFRDAIFSAWENECKTIYYIRTKEKSENEVVCESCAG